MIEYEHGMEPYAPMVVTVEVWPVAADKLGIWLVSGDDGPWPTLPVPADSDPQISAELELACHSAIGDLVALHQTSSRVESPVFVATYLAVLASDGLVRDRWPQAKPVSPKIASAIGQPPSHGAAEAPTVRRVDVLRHALRHLRFLTDPASPGYDSDVAAGMPPLMDRHLRSWAKDLYRLYDRTRESA